LRIVSKKTHHILEIADKTPKVQNEVSKNTIHIKSSVSNELDDSLSKSIGLIQNIDISKLDKSISD